MPRRSLLSSKAPPRGSVEYAGHAAVCIRPVLPGYWTTRLGQSTRLVKEGKKKTKSIKKMIAETWDSHRVGLGQDARGLEKCSIEVLDVSRLENPILFSNYFEQRKAMFAQCSIRGSLCTDVEDLPNSSGAVSSTEPLRHSMTRELYKEVNEQYLLHGTKPGNFKSILSKGLDPRFSAPNAMLGPGIYTTESFTKADQYTDPVEHRSDPGTVLYVILARVLLGKIYVCDRRRETSRLNGPPPGYDSIMADGQWMFREFSVHQNYRCYPEYIIKYKRTGNRSILGEQ